MNIHQAAFMGGAIRYDLADDSVDASFAYNFDLRGAAGLRLYFNVNNLLEE